MALSRPETGMFRTIINDHAIVRGVLRTTDLGYIAFGNDALLANHDEHSLFLVYHQGNWIWPTNQDRSDWTTTSATVVTAPKIQALFMGLYGQIFRVGSGDVSEESALQHLQDGPSSFGPMRCICAVEGRAYAVGMGRQAYRRLDQNRWERIDHTCRSSLETNNTYSFESMHGLVESNIFAAGRCGEVWKFDASEWTQEASATLNVLTDIRVLTNGAVLACGLDGTLVERTATGWIVVAHDITVDDFMSICEFKGRVYVSTMNDVYEYNDRSIVPVDFGTDRPQTFFCLSAAGDAMWSVGAKSIYSFDGATWQRIL